MIYILLGCYLVLLSSCLQKTFDSIRLGFEHYTLEQFRLYNGCLYETQDQLICHLGVEKPSAS